VVSPETPALPALEVTSGDDINQLSVFAGGGYKGSSRAVRFCDSCRRVPNFVAARDVHQEKTVNRLHLPGAIALVIILSGTTVSPQSAREASATDLVRRIVANELKAQDEDHSHWMYRMEVEDREKGEVREIIETPYGDLSRLLYVNGRPLSQEEQRKEDQRIQTLASNLGEHRKLPQARNEDGDEARRLLKMLPDALLFTLQERSGKLVKLSFKPNPSFKPPSREAHVFHEMEGEVWFDTAQNRLVQITGHLTHEVRFAGGLLGHLDRDGRFEVRQAEVAPGHWEVTTLNVDMKGRVLFFKTISVQQRECRTDFRRVPDNLTLAQAADILRRQALAILNRLG
jgi:hypothetical protein